MVLPDKSTLSANFDCVMMLTWSNWHTEMRSNRYHYATRFAKHLPVVFVQPDFPGPNFYFERTDVDKLAILHTSRFYGSKQSDLLNQALLSRGFTQPLLWIYNVYFLEFVLSRYSPLKIYHATEDYFNPTFLFNPGAEDLRNRLRRVLDHVDLVVAVSEGVKRSYVQNGGVGEKIIVLPNGCDYNFWSPQPEQMLKSVSCYKGKKIAFYQGGISFKLDFELLHRIVDGMPEWEFWFCGEVFTSHEEWNALRKNRNVKYFGKLRPDQVKELAYKSAVGIIPFVQNNWIVEKSHPLKAFEYVACGLPVVTVPIKSLEPFSQVFRFARSPDEFISSIRAAFATRWDQTALKERLEIAKKQDYDKRFESLARKIDALLATRGPNQIPAKILVLCGDMSNRCAALREPIEKLASFSGHRIFYLSIADGAKCEMDLRIFDAIIIVQPMQRNGDWDLPDFYRQAIREFGGFKILFAQDGSKEQQERVRLEIGYLGIHQVFTTLAEIDIKAIYPPSRFAKAEFRRRFPIYVAEDLGSYGAKPSPERKILLGIHGSIFTYPSKSWAEKGIGKVLEIIRNSLQEDGRIEPVESDKNEGARREEWHSFLEDCRAILITPMILHEDERGRVWRAIFEAISHKTALVFLEGIDSHFGFLRPDIHYIQLKEDFSNIDQLHEKLSDHHYLQELADRAYSDILKSDTYSYKKFIKDLDLQISSRVGKGNGIVLFTTLGGEFKKMEGELPSLLIRSLTANSLNRVVFNLKAGSLDSNSPTWLNLNLPCSFNLRAVVKNFFLNKVLKNIFVFTINPVMRYRSGQWIIKLIPESVKGILRKYYYRWGQS